MIYCSQCGKALADNAKFCQKCGSPVEIIPDEPRISYKSERETYEISQSSTGKILTVISLIITCIGILLTIFFNYFDVVVSISQLSFFGSDSELVSQGVGLFTIPNLMNWIQSVADRIGTEIPNSLQPLNYLFIIWLLDIIISLILLIRRFIYFSKGNSKYVAKAWYIPITPAITGILFNIFLNNIEQSFLPISIELTNYMYFLIVMIFINIIITFIGRNFNNQSNFNNIASAELHSDQQIYENNYEEVYTIAQDEDTVNEEIFELENIEVIKTDINNKLFSSEDGVLFSKNKTELIRCPAGKTGSASFNGREYIIPNAVKVIGSHAFANCSYLDSIVIPESVTEIGEGCFADCIRLKSIIIPKSIAKISRNAFSGCIGLEFVRISEGVTIIEESAFAHCDNMEELTIPKSLRRIEMYAFTECDKLKNIYYNGTHNQWKQVTVEDWNDELANASFHFEE